MPDLTRREVLTRLVAEMLALEPPVRVAIDGPDAAGKTTLVGELEVLIAGRADL